MSNSTPIQKSIAFLIVIFALICGGYFVFIHAPEKTVETADKGANKAYDLIRRIAKDFGDLIGAKPEVTISGETIIKATEGIAEFSPVKKQLQHKYKWTHTLLQSTKVIEMEADFTAKAGFDLTKPFSIDLSSDQKVIRTQMPPAKITSCQGSNYKTINELNGWWNGITTDERNAVINELNKQAKEKALKDGILKEADEYLKSQTEKIIRNAAPEAAIASQPLS
ncbi:MAG: DUF4230 domain-containing protein [Verrucomicrobiaceae bacterium]|jgi:hypothetical protein|nr:DUF4230 domain-containing protein [Verrucomicrobiaceae bacterium]